MRTVSRRGGAGGGWGRSAPGADGAFPAAALVAALGRTALAGVCLAVAVLVRPAGADAQVFMTQDEALSAAFPEPATVERASAFLDEAQLDSARALAGDDVRIEQAVITYYVGRRDGRPVGVAYFDAHRVRTMREVAMFVVTPDGRIDRVDVLKFAEPREYMASEAWIQQLVGRTLTDELAVDRGIVNMTGATLTAGALTRASRRVLALHRVIDPLTGEDDG